MKFLVVNNNANTITSFVVTVAVGAQTAQDNTFEPNVNVEG